MSRYLLDTNICIHALKNEFGIKQKIAEVGTKSCFLSEINFAEMLFGIKNSSLDRRARNRQDFEAFHLFLPNAFFPPVRLCMNMLARKPPSEKPVGQWMISIC